MIMRFLHRRRGFLLQILRLFVLSHMKILPIVFVCRLSVGKICLLFLRLCSMKVFFIVLVIFNFFNMKKRARFSSRESRFNWRELPFTSVLSYMRVLQPIARIYENSSYQLRLFREKKHPKCYAIFHARAALRYLEMYDVEPYIFKGFMYMRRIHYNDFFFHYNNLLKYIHYV